MLCGIKEFRPDDLVVTVLAGTSQFELDHEVRQAGLCLPFHASLGPVLAPRLATIGGLLAMGLPHGSEAAHGPVRDWCLGMKLVLPSGDVCDVGSKVAKSVSGFDLHRTMVGSRGGLAVIVEATLRLCPVKAVKAPDLHVVGLPSGPCWIARTLPAAFESVADACSVAGTLLAADCANSTLWSSSPVGGAAWQIGPDGARLPLPGPLQSKIESNLKAMMDPEGRLACGWQQ